MPVIAMTHEMGSLAKDVALQLAQELNLAVMRHEVVEHVAERMHVPTSLISRLREGKAGLVERFRTDDRSVAVYTAEEVLELADRGNVVLRGWGATRWLRPVPHVLCVRVTRSLARRVEWVMEHLQIDDEAFAEAEVQRSDHAHAARMHQRFGVTWGDPLLYDMILNTERLSVDSCVQAIRQMLQRPEFAETAASRAKLHDMTLEAHVRAALKAHPATQAVNITLEANAGTLVLRGIVVTAEEHAQAGIVAAGVPGVGAVDNQLRLMSGKKVPAPRGG
jgi:osmotically-inducible protein OsmY